MPPAKCTTVCGAGLTQDALGFYLFPNGERVCVVRPDDVPKALRLAEEAARLNKPELLAEAIGDRVTFLGFLRNVGGLQRVVDENGENPKPLERGDSFVERSILERIH